jgi:hypothetical protein
MLTYVVIYFIQRLSFIPSLPSVRRRRNLPAGKTLLPVSQKPILPGNASIPAKRFQIAGVTDARTFLPPLQMALFSHRVQSNFHFPPLRLSFSSTKFFSTLFSLTDAHMVKQSSTLSGGAFLRQQISAFGRIFHLNKIIVATLTQCWRWV